jgi:hypothetical protein
MMDTDVLTVLRRRRDSQQATVERLEQRLDEERAKLAAYELVIDDGSRTETPRASRRTRIAVTVADLRGLEPRDALVRIAERDDGTLRYTAARRAMVDAGLVAEGRDGIEEMRTLMNDHPRFERIIGEKGRYRLVELDEDDADSAPPYNPFGEPKRFASIR